MKRPGRQNRASLKSTALSDQQSRGTSSLHAAPSPKATAGEFRGQAFGSVLVLEGTSDGRFRFVEASSGLGESFGIPGDAIVGEFIEDVVPVTLAEQLFATCRICIDSGVPAECELPVDIADGRSLCHLILVPLLTTPGVPRRIAGILRGSTTDRTDAVHRSARRILSRLVNENDSGRLFETICRIAVEEECASYAWIELSTYPDGPLNPVAWFGAAEPGGPPFQASGDQEREDPAMIAVRENRSVCVKDIADSTRNGDGQWRNHLLRLGCRSCIALPLRKGESSSGVIMLLSPDSGSFSDEAIVELEALTADISHSLQAIGAELERRRDEELLRQSDELFRQLTDSIHAVFWLVDTRDRSHIYISAGYEEIWGRPRESVRANPDSWLDAIHPEDRERVRRAMHSEYADDREYRVVRPDGSIRWVRDRAFPVRNTRGEVVRVAGIAEDVTREKRSDDALHNRERELREAQRLARVGSWDWDAASGITTWSEEFFHVLGLDPEYDLPTDENRLRWYTPESARRLESALRRSIEEGIPYELELEQVRADGTRRWIAARSEIKRDAEGVLIGVRGAAQDITEQREAEAKIIRLASIVESSDDAIIGKTLDGTITSWNRGAQEMYGYSEQEVIGKSISILMPHGVDDDLPEILAHIRDGKHIKHSETVRRRKDGRTIRVSLTVSPLLDADGRVIGASAIARDVTDRYRAERALRILADINRALTHVETEQQLLDEACRIMVEVGGYELAWIGYANSDEALSITPVAAAGAHIDYASNVHVSWADNERGRGPGGTAVRSGKTVVFRDLATDPDFALWRKSALESGYKSIISIPLFTEGIATGVLGIYSAEIDAFDAEETGILDEAAAQISYGISALRTSTLRMQAEAARQLLASAVDQAAEVIVITDAESVIQYVNPAFESITGFSRAEVIGRTPQLFSSGLHGVEFYTELWETISSGRTWSGQFVNRKKDGSHYYENATISPVRNGDGTIVNYVAVKHDITRERELEEQLRQAQKMESVGRLAGGVAHDFNNMLQIMNGYIELSMTELEPGTSLYANLQQVRNVAHKSAELTGQLLAFARRQTVSPKLMAVNEAVSAALSMLRRLIGEDIELTWRPTEDTGRIMFDPSQFDQILTNLAANARDAISGVGSLIIEAANVEIDSAYCTHHSGFVPGSYVMLAVSDTGSGMDRETLSHLFEPFFTTKSVGQGTGLGLATVYGIVRQNNGLINVYSEPDHGSTFRIYFPRSNLDPVDVAAIAPSAARPRGTETLLIVEDESGILEIGKRVLDGLGYRVLAASTPEEAIRTATQFPGRIDLLITDVVMPQMNGRELSERLSKLRPQMRCLYMSGYTADVIAHRGLLDADVDFLPKPFSLSDLARKVRDTLA